jgi:hypothetical protein
MYMHERSLKRLLGLPKKLPANFSCDPVVVDGVLVYVTEGSEGQDWKHKSSKHRVRAICPECGKHTSAGRLFMHREIHGVKPHYQYYGG